MDTWPLGCQGPTIDGNTPFSGHVSDTARFDRKCSLDNHLSDPTLTRSKTWWTFGVRTRNISKMAFRQEERRTFHYDEFPSLTCPKMGHRHIHFIESFSRIGARRFGDHFFPAPVDEVISDYTRQPGG